MSKPARRKTRRLQPDEIVAVGLAVLVATWLIAYAGIWLKQVLPLEDGRLVGKAGLSQAP